MTNEEIAEQFRSSYQDYEVVVRFSVNAMSDEEAHEMMAETVADRIDGHLLWPQRSARVVSVATKQSMDDWFEALAEDIDASADDLAVRGHAMSAARRYGEAEGIRRTMRELVAQR
ncbi:hypothetical protein FHT44_005052 [Mycolicibacterium sp. BK634]|uniref:hypothetical protein n=1 Tax=Mycolicibacterium sp. BK634 TaxID=2587099 RepID=UPI00161FF5BF|nr:hypothetical protein [Mycolicibacterium sp. BK634]MBB3752540.1 hypothetical protein [Mycolicibacterium sp. BK634]